MPSVATLSGILCNDLKADSIASASTDSLATQKSQGRMVTRQYGHRAARESTAAAIESDVGSPSSEIKRFPGRVNHSGLSQTFRSRSRAHTSTLAGDAIRLARSDV